MSAEKSAKPATGADQAAFEALEKDFSQVLEQLAGDPNLERFQGEYKKLHGALKRSHTSEKRLFDKCQELNNEIVANASKVQAALRLSRQDQASIQILKKEIDKAWKLVDSAKSKEKQSRETIQRLRGEIQNLSKLVDQGAGLNTGQEQALNELLRVKNELTAENSSLQRKLAEKTRAQNDLIEQGADYRRKRKALEAQIAKMTDSSARQKRELHNMTQRLLNFQKNVQTMTGTQSDLRRQIAAKDAQYSQLKTEKEGLQADFENLDAQKQTSDQEASRAERKMQELYTLLDRQKRREEELVEKFNQSQQDLAKGRKEIGRLKFQLKQKSTAFDKMTDLKDRASKNQQAAETMRDTMLTEIKDIRREVLQQRRSADIDEKLVEELQNQVKRLSAQLAMTGDKNSEQLEIITAHEKNKKVMRDTIEKHQSDERQLKQEKFELEKQNDKVRGKAASWQQRFLEAQELILKRNNEIKDLDKKLEEGEKKLKLQKNLYEQVRADRNFFSKKHVIAQDTLAEMREKQRIMKHQITQLKQEIKKKDKALVAEHFQGKQLGDELKVKDRRLNRKNEVLETADKVLASQNTEIQNLRRTLEAAEGEQKTQKKIYEDVVQERDILAAQLIRRNDELALLYEKIRIQQSTLSKGETQYRQRLDDIKMLRLQLTSIKREIEIRNHEVENTEMLKNELYSVQRELLQEKTKVKALSEELENPMNVHRWRQLEGSDPKRWELIQKIQTLQKRLITKTEEAVEKDLLLKEKEKLYVELKGILARQPGPELAEQLSAYQQSLKEKTRQMKAMAAELNMHQAQLSEYRYEIERLSRELQDSKRKFYDQKRKDQLQREIIREQQQSDPMTMQRERFHATQPKIAGGGFNLTPKPLAS